MTTHPPNDGTATVPTGSSIVAAIHKARKPPKVFAGWADWDAVAVEHIDRALADARQRGAEEMRERAARELSLLRLSAWDAEPDSRMKERVIGNNLCIENGAKLIRSIAIPLPTASAAPDSDGGERW